jgi:hypothetical protein
MLMLLHLFKLCLKKLSGDRGSTVVKDCAKNRKVAGSIPDGVIGFFRRHNPSDRTMALGLTQPLTEMGVKAAGA